ncbi:hypothetical protein FEM48_ZijujUnG0117600 [Ziziphus jujuba var. spinosa]|uniref:Amino acid transporter transmembrane domain-containing protein n=1 Tax=Ziziphus jujuba var. spinosa TaxID=714518 RepID=A0A978U7W0_ZIZJJ|nr:hypothetical protein FEM48_ZijujUnG0117600 [Ziziphus jujuba var. spinosa]
MRQNQKQKENDVPLLADFKSLEHQNAQTGASFTGSIFNISTTMIGAGIMSIPATMKVLGIVPGFVLILVVAFLVEVTVEFLLRYTHSGESNTYAGMAAESFGRFGSVTVQICVVITNLGCLIIYFIIVGDVLCGTESDGTVHLGVLQEWFGVHWWNSRAYALLFIAVFVMLPLVMLRRVDSLKHSSAVSILLAVFFVAVSSAMATYALFKGKTQKLRLFPDFSQVSVFDLFTTIPVFVTGFGFHVNVHPIRAELGKASDMKPAVRISIVICIAIYFAIGFFGYLLYAVHLLLVYPIMNFSLRVNIDELLFPKKPDLASDTTRFVSMTCVLLALTYIVAIAIPNIWYFFQFMGSTTIVCLSFIFPGAIILRDVHGISTRGDKIIAILVIISALVTSIIAISTNLSGSET